MNILDYLDWRGDLTFAERELNEVDSLIFSVLSYIEIDDFVSEDGEQRMTVAELYRAYTDAGRKSSLQMLEPEPLLKKAAECPRFKDVVAAFYVNRLDDEQHLQMSAVTFLYAEGQAYVAYRGTDSTLVGWREDFNFSFLDETPGQRAAADYLNYVAEKTDRRLTVGGHSKGGNFAVYACACCDKAIRDERIVKIYSNDGPGFRSDVLEANEGYASIKDRVVKLVPGSSPVGILLDDMEERRFIRSVAKGAMQHNPFSWCVTVTRFEDTEERSQFSYFLDGTLSKWISGMAVDERRTLVDTFFDALMGDGAKTIGDLGENKIATSRAMFKALAGIESERKSELLGSLQKLFTSGFDTVRSGAMGAMFSRDNKNKTE